MHRFLSTLRAVLLALFCLFLLALLLLQTDAAIDGARRGLTLCCETLLPSLFPFLVFSELLVASGAGEALGRFACAPLQALFGLSGAGAVSLALGSGCGFPVGSATALAYRRQGAMSKEELQRVTLFANNPSSGFLIAAVGAGLFGSKRAGIALFLITLTSAAVIGLFLRFLLGKVPQIPQTPSDGARNGLSVETFTGSVRRALFTFLQIAALVVFFSSVATATVSLIGFLEPPALFAVLLHGALELTGGAAAATAMLPPRAAFLAVAFLASFSGLSVCLQIHTLTEGEGTRMSAYLLAKTAQGLVALTLAEGYLLIARPALTPSESVAAIAPAHAFPLLAVLTLLTLTSSVALHEKRRAEKRALS